MLWLELLLKITLYSISGVMHYVISYYAKTYCKSAVSMLLCERANVSSQADDTLGQNILALSRRLIYINIWNLDTRIDSRLDFTTFCST